MRILISHVFVHTRHDNMHPMNTQAACHTAQDITLMHAADKNTNCVQHNKTHRRTCGRANSRPHTHTMRQNMEHECLNPEWRDPNTTLQHARLRENRTCREYQGSVTKPWITLDRSNRTLTLKLSEMTSHLRRDDDNPSKDLRGSQPSAFILN